jgi:hypothetical protein
MCTGYIGMLSFVWAQRGPNKVTIQQPKSKVTLQSDAPSEDGAALLC